MGSQKAKGCKGDGKRQGAPMRATRRAQRRDGRSQALLGGGTLKVEKLGSGITFSSTSSG
jgi:hypothetical protein